ncbi:hypothetical protein CDAR_319361 [Caerostris darwini]|uniref:Ribosomal protein S14 n=1 Tax=Caerostris darwini TaxID=1538125 RepID=A0AAV4TN68_9ARAC|nr:hypothetical protein CDAR_319361 [Caerostris darwini]
MILKNNAKPPTKRRSCPLYNCVLQRLHQIRRRCIESVPLSPRNGTQRTNYFSLNRCKLRGRKGPKKFARKINRIEEKAPMPKGIYSVPKSF